MDSVIEQLLTQLGRHLAQELDFTVDPERFTTDPEFAAQVLALGEELHHAPMRILVTEIRNRQLQLLALHGGSSHTAATPARPADLSNPLPPNQKPV